MKRTKSLTAWVILASNLLVICLVPAPAIAGIASQATCIATLRNTISPGLTMSPANVSYGTADGSGTIDCLGEVNGHAVTGPGTIRDRGNAFSATCTSGSGIGKLSVKIPTTAGEAALDIPVEFTLIGPVGLRPGGMFPGGFALVPIRGDCILTPITEVSVVVFGTLLT